MAKSKETFNKKLKEQLRFKQKQDKQLKKEEKKANKKKGVPLEEMMAYLDENGNLSDKPPDPKNHRIVNVEDIQIGVPKHEETEETFRNGNVIFYNRDKGFGFINDQLTKERVFFHVNDLLDPVEEADNVQFMVERGPRGFNATQIKKIS